MTKKTLYKTALFGMAGIAVVAAFLIYRTMNRVQVEFNIHINKQLIYESVYGEPPQFAIWLESKANKKRELVFVTHRAAVGDWEGKPDVPVAVPFWTTEFKDEKKTAADGVTGATPKDETFRIRIEVPPGSEWTAWIEMNLAGDYNDFYPQFNRETKAEDEFSCGQPALLYRADIKADKGNHYTPTLYKMSLWEKGTSSLAPVDTTITSADRVFDPMSIDIIRPKPQLIDHHAIKDL